MPRLPRIKVDGAVYYVISKASQNEVIFNDKEDYRMYLDLVTKYKSQHNFRLFSYCLLPDRLELLIETGDDSTISEIMHDLNSLYTKYFNGRYQKHGHLFESRFRSVLVEKSRYLLEATRRMHRAPKDFADYPYSSFILYKGGLTAMQPDLSAEIAEVSQFLKRKDQPGEYEKYVLEGNSAEMQAIDKRLRRGSVLGSEAFEALVDETARQHVEQLKSDSKPKPMSRVTLVMIGGLVLLAAGTSLYLYLSRQVIQSRYTELVSEKNAEFIAKTQFENLSPIALTELDGTSWRLDLISSDPDGVQAALPDTVHFSEGSFWSEHWGRQGFKPAQYSLLVRPGGRTTWEALLKNTAGDMLSWRGDWQGDVMRGAVRWTPAGKTAQAFSFFSAGWSYAEVAG